MTSFQSSIGGAIRQKGLDESTYFGQAIQRLPAIMANSPLKALTIITVVNVALGIFIVLGMYAYNNYWHDREKKELETKEGRPIYRYIPDVLVFLSVGGINCLLATIVKVQLNAFLVLSITACSLAVAILRHFISIKIIQDNKKNIELKDTKAKLDGVRTEKDEMDKKKRAIEEERDLLKKQLADANLLLENERTKTVGQEKIISALKLKVRELEGQIERSNNSGFFSKSAINREAVSSAWTGTSSPIADRAYGRFPDAGGQAQKDASGTRTDALKQGAADFQRGLPSPTSSRLSLSGLKSRPSPAKEANGQKNGGSSSPGSQGKASRSIADRLVNLISSKESGDGDIPSSPYNMMDQHK